jgi:hypothetical protein
MPAQINAVADKMNRPASDGTPIKRAKSIIYFYSDNVSPVIISNKVAAFFLLIEHTDYLPALLLLYPY